MKTKKISITHEVSICYDVKTNDMKVTDQLLIDLMGPPDCASESSRYRDMTWFLKNSRMAVRAIGNIRSLRIKQAMIRCEIRPTNWEFR